MLRAGWIAAFSCGLAGLFAAPAAFARTEIVSWSYAQSCSVEGFELRYGPSPGSLNDVIDVGLPLKTGGQFSYALEIPGSEEAWVCVAAFRGQQTSPCSDPVPLQPGTANEQPIAEPPPDQGLHRWCEDFSSGTQQSTWRNTPDFNHMFQVEGDADGNQSLTTFWGNPGGTTDFYSHFIGTDGDGVNAAQWSRYEYSGQMMVDDDLGGVGVTFYSRHTMGGSLYRLGREPGTSSFQLQRSEVDPSYGCPVVTDVAAESGQWYAFRVEASQGASSTVLRGKVWPADEREPEDFQFVCTDGDSSRQLAGSIGVWAQGAGVKWWDDLHVSALPAPSQTPLGAPGKPELMP